MAKSARNNRDKPKTGDEQMTKPNYTNHALERMSQRDFSRADIEYVLKHGRRSRKEGGSLRCELSPSDIPRMDYTRPCVKRLAGSTVILERPNGGAPVVITAYKHVDPYHADRVSPRHNGRHGKTIRKPIFFEPQVDHEESEFAPMMTNKMAARANRRLGRISQQVQSTRIMCRSR